MNLVWIGAIGAAVGALVSGVVNGLFNLSIKRRELQVQRYQVALKCAELKHQQLLAVQEWTIKAQGRAGNMDFWDPLTSVIDYMEGLEEFERTGDWSKAKRGKP